MKYEPTQDRLIMNASTVQQLRDMIDDLSQIRKEMYELQGSQEIEHWLAESCELIDRSSFAALKALRLMEAQK